jgi:septum site-determining protein MinC
MSDNAVIFKGTKEGLYILLKEDIDFEAIKDNLERKIKPSKRFFEGAKIVNLKGKHLTKGEFEELKNILSHDYGMEIIGKYSDSISEAAMDKEEIREIKAGEKLPYDCIAEGDSLIVRATVRSGQLIEYQGNIIIIGDVNPGAHLKATGSIIVMGSMRGVAHAGTQNNYEAFIAAFNLLPTQLRIGDIITRSPDGLHSRVSIPEMAVVKQGMIVVEPYLPNK